MMNIFSHKCSILILVGFNRSIARFKKLVFGLPLFTCIALISSHDLRGSINGKVSTVDSVRKILQLDGPVLIQERIRLCESLPSTLSVKECELLFDEVQTVSLTKLAGSRHNAVLFNDLLNFLKRVENPLADYTERLAKIAQNLAVDEVYRDYAVQHMLAYAEFRMAFNERVELLETIRELSFEQMDTTLPGTYLLGAYSISKLEGDASTTIKPLVEDAFEIAQDKNALNVNRISAIQICGQAHFIPVLPLAREIALNESEDTGLRSAAIATLGNFLTQEDHVILQDLANTSISARVKYAAREALK